MSKGSFFIANHIFIQNSAKEGGAVFVSDLQPLLINNSFLDNQALSYGSNIGSVPLEYRILELESEIFNFSDQNDVIDVRPSFDLALIKKFRIGFFDFYGQLVNRSFPSMFFFFS